MFKTVFLSAMLAVAAFKPVSEMSLEEVAKRMAELTMEIAISGGEATEEQAQELAALEARMDELMGQLDAAVDAIDAESQKREQEIRADQPPESTPIDAIGRAFQKALPDVWEGETCNTDVKDSYVNLTPWFKSRGMSERGQQFSRTCGDRTTQWFTWELATFEVGEVDPDGFSPDKVPEENRELVEFPMLCGYQAYVTPAFNIVSLNIAGKAEMVTNASYSYDIEVAPGAVLEMQKRMADAVDCKAIARALAGE